LEDLSDVIWRHQVQAPVWGIHLPETQAEQRREWGDLVDDAQAPIWLALCQEQAVGCQGYFPAPASEDNPLIPEQCVELGVAGTREWIRGRGIGQALTRHVLAHARSVGYRYCLTDWRSTNLLSSRFWPRQGFRPVAYRLARRIDPRISWAGERRA
jgi:GNAT superfamily N-acetyltransferase